MINYAKKNSKTDVKRSFSTIVLKSVTWLMLLALPVFAENSIPDVSKNSSNSKTSVTQKVWEYEPVDRDFWAQLIKKIEKNEFLDIIDFAEQKIKGQKRDSAKYNEAKLAQVIGLSGAGIHFAATKMASDIIRIQPGTSGAVRALSVIEEIVKDEPVDEDEVFGEVVLEQDENVDKEPTADFINYYNALFNELHGYPVWSEKHFKKLTSGSYWDYRYKYYLALLDVRNNQIDSAIEKFASLMSNPLTPVVLKMDSGHQYARLLFEKKDYKEAYKIYREITLNPRERGLILLERAWAMYYEKNYSKALGLLTALESPAFDSARSPEAYILKMLIYKELCYYNAVFDTQKEYKKRFAASLEIIKKRKNLSKDQVIVNMAALDRHIGNWVSFLNNLKEEKKKIKDLKLGTYSFGKEINALYDSKIAQLYEKLDWMVAAKARKVANQIIDLDDQISYLDYQTRLDSLRISRSFGETDYKQEEVPHMSFDKIFWIHKGEFWLDEIEKLKVLVDSKCSQQAASPGGGKK